jgi:hypothetical protein
MTQKQERSSSPLRHRVQAEQCKSCIFRKDGVKLSPERMAQIENYLAQGKTHMCHSPALDQPGSKKRNTRACRGGRDYVLEIWFRMGLIPEPTDAALEEEMRKYLKEQSQS